jgi:hypothetical protein
MAAAARHVIVPPHELRDGFEVSVHTCPAVLQEELQIVFPARERGAFKRAIVVVTCQHAALDLVNFGPDADREKDALLERVCTCCRSACARCGCARRCDAV